jgi:hypothetical protein
MMYNAEQLCVLAHKQYGSRKGHRSVELALNKRLTFDMARLRKRPMGMCSNDAKSCYDRIVHSIAMLAVRRTGAPVEPLICMFTTLQDLHHHVRTIYGDSEESFTGGLWSVPIQGIGQGNGAGPTLWALISTPLLNILQEEGLCVAFKTALSGNKVTFAGYIFVDDSDTCVCNLTMKM